MLHYANIVSSNYMLMEEEPAGCKQHLFEGNGISALFGFVNKVMLVNKKYFPKIKHYL